MRLSPRLAAILVLVVVLSAGAAAAKGPAPFQVVTPEGEVFEVTGADARAWWEDLWANPDPPPQPFPCCASPRASARFGGAVWAQWGKRAAEIPEPYLIRGGWTGLFYPSHLEAPPYLVMPLAQGGGGRRWPSWRVATERMEDIILGGAAAAKDRGPDAGGKPIAESASEVWPVAAAGVLVAGAGEALRRRRRP